MRNDYEVACVHWSNWHPTERNHWLYGYGWTEWEYLKRALPLSWGCRAMIPLIRYYTEKWKSKVYAGGSVKKYKK